MQLKARRRRETGKKFALPVTWESTTGHDGQQFPRRSPHTATAPYPLRSQSTRVQECRLLLAQGSDPLGADCLVTILVRGPPRPSNTCASQHLSPSSVWETASWLMHVQKTLRGPGCTDIRLFALPRFANRGDGSPGHSTRIEVEALAF